jgi:hypothetical protein
MTQYNADILQRFADDLYLKAGWITLKYCLVGAAIGALLVIVVPFELLASQIHIQANSPSTAIPVGVISLIGGLIGGTIGQRKWFQLRLQAQLTLCQMQTEFNTRQKPVPVV